MKITLKIDGVETDFEQVVPVVEAAPEVAPEIAPVPEPVAETEEVAA